MNKKTEAKSNGAMLTVGFHAATPPLVWRFDLERNHSFTLSLQGEEGDWELGVTSSKGDFYPIVHFDTRENAEEALVKVERALAVKNSLSSIVLKTAAALVVILVLFVVVLPLTFSLRHKGNVSAAPAAIENGVPLSADDILKSSHP